MGYLDPHSEPLCSLRLFQILLAVNEGGGGGGGGGKESEYGEKTEGEGGIHDCVYMLW